MKQIILYFNKPEADKKISILSATKTDLQSVCDEFNSLNPAFNISIEEIPMLFAEVTDPQATILRPDIDQIKSLILNKLLPDGKLNGMPVSIEKYQELFQMPNTDSLLKKLKKVHPLAIEFLNAGFYAINKAGKIVITPGAEEQVNESFKIYAETDEELNRLEKAKALAKALNDICSIANNELKDMSDIQMVVEFDEAGQFIVNSDFVKTGNVGQYMKFVPMNYPQPVKQEPAPIPGTGFSDDFLKNIGLGRMPEPTPEPSPVDFDERMKSINQ